jgi:hypothetical protein
MKSADVPTMCANLSVQESEMQGLNETPASDLTG